MELLEIILFLLALVVISSIAGKFIKFIPEILIQISVGFIACLLIPGDDSVINPDIFFCLFIAPLLFLDAKNAKKLQLLKVKREILFLALPLVLITVLLLGAFISAVTPIASFYIAAAFAAALAPTDAVSIKALRGKINLPSKIEHTLEGEALVNDASGIVTFKFALAFAIGTKEILKLNIIAFEFTGLLIYVLFVGVFVGAIFILIKIAIQKALYNLGLDDTDFHTLIELLTPFLVFIIAEKVDASGIIAVVTAGIIQSFGFRQFTPKIGKQNVVTDSSWSVLSYVLNSLVFILLGYQISEITEEIFEKHETYLNLVLLSFAILFVLYLVRFVWSFVSVSWYDCRSFKIALKNSLIITLAGVKGTVTLATIMSIPLGLEAELGEFSREQILFTGILVILLSILVANIFLPIISPNIFKNNNRTVDHLKEVEIDLLQIVINNLRKLNDSKQYSIIIIGYEQRLLKLKDSKAKFSRQDYIDMLRDPENHPEFLDAYSEKRGKGAGARAGGGGAFGGGSAGKNNKLIVDVLKDRKNANDPEWKNKISSELKKRRKEYQKSLQNALDEERKIINEFYKTEKITYQQRKDFMENVNYLEYAMNI
jgi:Na+/H+ antiporter